MNVKYQYDKEEKNIKIINSYEITEKKQMIAFLETLPLQLIKRTIKSCLNEWIAHNRLYKIGLFKEHCNDCDLTMNEGGIRKMCYWILSRFKK